MKRRLGLSLPPFFKGKKHTEEAKRKMSEGHKKYVGKLNHFYGKHHTEKAKRVNAEKHKGKKHTVESRRKMSKAQKGRISPMKGRKHTKEAKDKLRKYRIKRFGNRGWSRLMVGEHENEILDEVEREKNTKITRQYGVLLYFIDGYDEKNNIAYEVDEPHHFYINGELKEKDKIRQSKIENHLKCKFIRIKVEDWLNGNKKADVGSSNRRNI